VETYPIWSDVRGAVEADRILRPASLGTTGHDSVWQAQAARVCRIDVRVRPAPPESFACRRTPPRSGPRRLTHSLRRQTSSPTLSAVHGMRTSSRRSANCTQTMPSGLRSPVYATRGQLAIAAAVAKEHAAWARSRTIRISNVAVRELPIDHSVVTFSWKISTGSTGDARSGTTLLVAAHKDGRWIIVTGQASAAVPRRAPARGGTPPPVR